MKIETVKKYLLKHIIYLVRLQTYDKIDALCIESILRL